MFDGDEGSFYALMNYETVAEAHEVMNVKQCILTAAENKNIVGLVMDSISAAHVLTADYEEVNYISPVKVEFITRPSTVDIETFMSCLNLMTEQSQLSTLIERGINYGLVTIPERVKEEIRGEIPIVSTFQPERYSIGQVRIMIQMLLEEQIDKTGKTRSGRTGEEEFELYTAQELHNMSIDALGKLFFSSGLRLPEESTILDVISGRGSGVPKEKVTILDLYREHGLLRLPGKLLFSALLPEDFYYEEEGVLIRDGILISGSIGKQHVGPYVHRSIIQMLHKQYGVNRTVAFLTDAPWVLNHYFTERGFTVGPKDCQFKSTYRFDMLTKLIDSGIDKSGNIKEKWEKPDPEVYTPQELDKLSNEKLEALFRKNKLRLPGKQSELAKEELQQTRLEIEALGPRLDDPLEEAYREQQIVMKVKDIKQFGIKIAKEAMQGDNSLRIMISGAGGGGAKGSVFNVAQTLGMLGQPFFKGKRIEQTITNRTRCLPHFPVGSEELEARGFCKHSFWEGMTPAEFFFHLYGTREGILDTAMNTQQSGDMHHRIVKGLENIKIHNDGSVRNMVKTVFQVVYGTDGMGAENLINVPTETGTIRFFMDVELEAKKLNAKAGWMLPIKP